ncbi:MAG: hypothetical protein E3J29_07070 [Dehalococcoidia bacterium]|nr:MAG: hypothetical protein E3J29_07070 [Dehalococcoidia bacterium]
MEFTLTYGATIIGGIPVTHRFAGGDASPETITIATAFGPLTLEESPAQPLRLRIRFTYVAKGQTLTMYYDDPGVTGQTYLNTPGVTVDELGWRLLLLVPLVPAVPLLMRVMKRRKARRIGA